MLTFNLKKEWFDKIKSGQKTHEYREVNKYWIKRLTNLYKSENEWDKLSAAFVEYHGDNNLPFFVVKTSTPVCFACGYPRKDDKEKRLYGKVTAVGLRLDGNNTDLKINKPVFDIKFELFK